MNWLDLVLAAILIMSVVSGLRSGLVRVLVGTAATVLAFLLASQLYNPVAALFADSVSSPQLASLIGFLIIFIGVMLLGGLVSKIVRAALKLVGLSFLDRLLGGAFGLGRAVIIGSILVMALLAFSPTGTPSSVSGSALAPVMIEGANVLSYLTPDSVKQQVHGGYDRVKRLWSKPSKTTI